MSTEDEKVFSDFKTDLDQILESCGQKVEIARQIQQESMSTQKLVKGLMAKLAKLQNEVEGLKEQVKDYKKGTSAFSILNKCATSIMPKGLVDTEKKNLETMLQATIEFGGKCLYCESSLAGGPRNKPERDHYIPLDKGGQDHPWNVLPVCKKCNGRKGAKWPSEFVEAGRREICEAFLLEKLKTFSNESQNAVELFSQVESIVNEYCRRSASGGSPDSHRSEAFDSILGVLGKSSPLAELWKQVENGLDSIDKWWYHVLGNGTLWEAESDDLALILNSMDDRFIDRVNPAPWGKLVPSNLIHQAYMEFCKTLIERRPVTRSILMKKLRKSGAFRGERKQISVEGKRQYCFEFTTQDEARKAFEMRLGQRPPWKE